MSRRERFRCTKCGLRVEGVLATDGRVRAYDRSSAPADRRELPFTCQSCLTIDADTQALQYLEKAIALSGAKP